ncbi:MAG: TetR/AcrR family transcriptional regulator [Spirochaetota bacterium]|jgi:AcrR family transcriptional regulator|nr:TetR/AcrR family transcriptional regulator [Spirochaetota bacterium]
MMEKATRQTSDEKVLAAALKEFAEHGFDGARVDRIAKNARVNKAMIYYHFKSKEALYERILSDLAGMIYERVVGVIVEESDPREQLYTIIHRYIETLTIVDRNMLRTMLREIASGGKFFKKLAIPKLILPVIAKIEPIFRAAQERGDLKRELDPLYTFLQIIGGIVFFNIIQIPMRGTILEERAFQGDYAARFEENLMGILKNGIESGEKRR